MSRLADAFAQAQDEGRAALVAYLMAGDPDLDASERHMRAVLDEVDVLEIGIPFSEPVADGPVIERAGVRALARGTRVGDVLALCARLRAASDKPLVLMTYYNPVYRRGPERFAREAREAGVDGVILPDVPYEESAVPGRALETHGLDLVQLASPATPPARLRMLAKATRGFLYVVSSFGVTGARSGFAPETLALVRRAREAAEGRAPVAVGFGVSEPAHVRALHDAGAQGVIVGSALVRRIEEGQAPGEVAAFARALRQA